MEVDPLISANTPLAQIIILESDTQQTLSSTLDMQMDPLVNLPNIVVDDIGDITLEPGVGPHTIINTSAPQVVDPNPSSHKATRLEKSIEDYSNSNHAPINLYLWHPRPLILEIPIESKLIAMVVSMNYLPPSIEGRGLMFK
jgi:hypothetical protein